MTEQDDDKRASASLAAARRTLRAGVEKSRALCQALLPVGTRLEVVQAALPTLEVVVRPICALWGGAHGDGKNMVIHELAVGQMIWKKLNYDHLDS